MSQSSSLDEYKELVAAFLRERENHWAQGNPDRLKEIEAASSDDILRKWLWIVSIVGGVICFVVLPLGLAFLQRLIPSFLMAPLWVFLKLAMGLVLIAFFLAIYLTTSKPSKEA